MNRFITRSIGLTALLSIACALAFNSSVAAQENSGVSPATFFNRANAFARAGNTGQAVLNYERARQLAPGDDDIAANEHTVRARAGLPDVPTSRLTRLSALASPNAFAWLGCAGLCLAGISWVLRKVLPNFRGVLGMAMAAGILCVLCAAANAVIVWPSTQEAVVVARETTARVSPATVADNVFKLREGETVIVKAEGSEFDLVQGPSGQIGWVAQSALQRVVTAAN